MIGRILYRETVHGVLNYVFGKEGSITLGFQNTLSQSISEKFFTDVLHFQGQRHSSASRYVHITLNLPHGEHLDDKTFNTLAQDYMHEMGYGEQPYVVVRHNDTIHEHVHIVSTTVKEDGQMINLSFDHRRNVATQRFLEKGYGLSPSPETKSYRELPQYRLPEQQFSSDETNGTKFYLQDVLNSTLQKHKVRSFDELALLVRPYHIVVSTITNENGRVGVAYGIDNQKQYKTQFINGSTVHPKLSGPKLEAIFERNKKSKLLPMHKKRLEKQLATTFNLFKSIDQEDVPDVLKSYQNIDCELLYGKKEELKDIVIHDKSGYVFRVSKKPFQSDLNNYLKMSDSESKKTVIAAESKQFVLETQKLIKNAFYESYLDSNKSDLLLSESVMTKNLKDILPYIAKSERFSFLDHYSDKNNGKTVLKVLQEQFKGVRQDLSETETKKEITTLESRVSLLKMVLENGVFDTNKNNSVPFYLVQSLGLKYDGEKVSFRNSNAHYVTLSLHDFKLQENNEAYISTGSVRQNEKVLKMLVEEVVKKDDDLNASSFFLPLLLPELYDSMTDTYREQFERESLKAYLKTSERSHSTYEKSPVDYIKLFNAKGFYFERNHDKIYVRSVYSKLPVSIPLAPKTQAYLSSIKNLDKVLSEQQHSIENIAEQGRDKLNNLWFGYLVEKGLYDKAAYAMVHQNVRPNLSNQAMEHHLANGLREKIVEVSNQKISYQHAAILRKGLYAFSALLGGSGYKEEEMFNGFKDEFTDFTKRKGMFI
ncbi:relaxase/mobilization nuclease domain-containing protein [Maribacter sp. 4G9]|uniref:relaxase/mobilization nuclease domain-containing protein n=1 Tax=Maribacter sp. 4G9 TaxID=1889777 RepID=UPI000C145130|nr:relaxase/mobilization nuclease domain-containing protein [Maribacter sp. 4G9]PIB31453.1 hypothetical protein BFP75_01515 [Maribacter sp. 4G9]